MPSAALRRCRSPACTSSCSRTARPVLSGKGRFMAGKSNTAYYAMRIQARPGSPVEKNWYPSSSLPGVHWDMPKAIAPGIAPAPLEDLLFHGGRVVPQMGFQNIYLGSGADWSTRDITLIDAAITRAMQDRGLNNVMAQYFAGARLAC